MVIHASRERPEKILVAMHRLSTGDTRLLDYDDIVVEVFRLFPGDFSLRKYPEYPDSSDVHKPLYGVLKKHGLIRAANKQFGLTQRGIEVAHKLTAKAGASLSQAETAERLSRPVELELERMLKSAAYQLHIEGRENRILDTDFYAFLGCTVRTQEGDFQGRLYASKKAIETASRLRKPSVQVANSLRTLMSDLERKFEREIGWKTGKRELKAKKNGR